MQSSSSDIRRNNRLNEDFYTTCSKGKVEEVEKLLSLHPQINPNWKFNSSQTPLYIACYDKRIDVVKVLLKEKRVDVNQPNKNEVTPFWIVCQIGCLDIVKLFLNDWRVDVNKPRKDGVTPFLIACYFGHFDIVECMLESERDVKLDQNKRAMDAIRKKNYSKSAKILELLESCERNTDETRFKLRIQKGLVGNWLFMISHFYLFFD